MIPRSLLRLFALFVLFAASTWSRHAQGSDARPPIRRMAVVIGANQPAPGRQALRYAHEDARRMGDTLVRVGHFAAADVNVLLEPKADEVLKALDRVTAQLRMAPGDSLLVVYYSGHSDGQRLFPNGETLTLAALRAAIQATGARVQISILDACRGGSWTGTKGLSVGPPLDATDLLDDSTEGQALLSSSSGLENAHEAGSIKGSFFTHHVVAGLLGAADKSGDGNVTLQEVFEYARERTVRDSARMAATTQHPSFDVRLRGRHDLVLAQLASSPSALELSQQNTVEVIHLGSGVTVAETPAGPKRIRLALAPGRYLVRRVDGARVYSKEVDVQAGATVTLNDAQLELAGNAQLAMKGDVESPESLRSLPGKGRFELRLAGGIGFAQRPEFTRSPVSLEPSDGEPLRREPAFSFSFGWGLTKRLTLFLPTPALALRLGQEGAFEVIPRAGLTALGYSSVSGMLGTVDAGAATRAWLTPSLSLATNTYATWDWSAAGHVLSAQASTGLIWNLGSRVTLALGVGWSGSMLDGQFSRSDLVPRTLPPELDRSTSSSLVLGSVQSLGYRSIPLLQIHVTPRFSLDAYATWSIDLRTGRVHDRYLAGFTYTF